MSSTETPTPATEQPVHRDDSSDGIGIAKSRLATHDQEVGKQDLARTVQEQPLRRYWVRPLILILIPTIIAVYFAVIWVHLLQNKDHDDAVNYRNYSGSLIYYSWFIIGVFGLSWTKYGLVGLEASMLRSRFWRAPNLLALLMHSNTTWSSPSGWTKAIRHRQFYRLWSLLTFLSFLPFIAFPLSGLVFEITDGYIQTSEVPFVQGLNSTTFNEIYGREGNTPAHEAWLVNTVPTIPGFGVLYTRESVDRTKYSNLGKVPNSLPLTESIPDLFLAPQADQPVSGKAWGLRVKYDCSIVRSASEFTILSEKSASIIVSQPEISIEDGIDGAAINLQTPQGASISLWKGPTAGSFYNARSYFEIGTSGPEQGKYNGEHPDFEAHEGDTSLVFEYALWQYRIKGQWPSEKPFNTTVGPSIEGMGSPIVKSDNNTYTVNSTFFSVKGNETEDATDLERMTNASELLEMDDLANGIANGSLPILHMAPPVGVRCVASSGLGTAELDGVTSTFRDYQRSDPIFNDAFSMGPIRFGYNAHEMLAGQYYQHYISGGLSGHRPDASAPIFVEFVDAVSLLRSVSLAYAMDAIDLMYGFTSGYKRPWPEPGLTSSRRERILTEASLTPGSGVVYFVLALFCIWAALSAGLALWYGFRKRPADRLDGYTILRTGADRADELKENEEFMSGKPFLDSKTLAALPGS